MHVEALRIVFNEEVLRGKTQDSGTESSKYLVVERREVLEKLQNRQKYRVLARQGLVS